EEVRDWLEQLEAAAPVRDELLAMLVYVAGRNVEIDDAELNAARRRALLVHASGGDLHRELTLDARAADVLAEDLDSDERRAELGRGLAGLRDGAARLPLVRGALADLLADMPLAWRIYAVALLAEELAD
ncbi:MAG TPA: hypothetical protein VKA21_16210, partial [Candidatus Binatia bacterium]|nr:hypothetical protein [Candidatus Binatia bacterium]